MTPDQNRPPANEDAGQVGNETERVIPCRYGNIINRDGEWRFQWHGGRGGTPPERSLAAATGRMPVEAADRAHDEINRALEEAGEKIRVAGMVSHRNPRAWLG